MNDFFYTLFTFTLGVVAGCIISGAISVGVANTTSDKLKKELCKYEIEYCSKEELLKRMEDK